MSANGIKIVKESMLLFTGHNCATTFYGQRTKAYVGSFPFNVKKKEGFRAGDVEEEYPVIIEEDLVVLEEEGSIRC